jgi:polyisoprenoid-binding protein YceI
MNRFTIALAVAVLAPVAALAAPPSWTMDEAASSLRFSSSLGGDAFAGSFRQWDANIRFDPADLAHSSVTVTVDVASAATGSSDRDQALPGSDFFAATKFPRAIYQANSFRKTDPDHYLAIGTLTMRGVSKPLNLPFTLSIVGPTARMTAQTAINRLAFGVGQNEWKATTTLPDAVRLSIAVTARKAK